MTMMQTKVFVYGTLKRGCVNHRLCADYLTGAEAATIVGHIYDTPPGFPVVDIPPTLRGDYGSDNLTADAGTCAKANRRVGEFLSAQKSVASDGSWGTVKGELLTFATPDVLERLDQLEGFRPWNLNTCLYHRVLTPIMRADGTTEMAWVYITAQRPNRSCVLIPSGEWIPLAQRVVASKAKPKGKGKRK